MFHQNTEWAKNTKPFAKVYN